MFLKVRKRGYSTLLSTGITLAALLAGATLPANLPIKAAGSAGFQQILLIVMEDERPPEISFRS